MSGLATMTVKYLGVKKKPYWAV